MEILLHIIEAVPALQEKKFSLDIFRSSGNLVMKVTAVLFYLSFNRLLIISLFLDFLLCGTGDFFKSLTTWYLHKRNLFRPENHKLHLQKCGKIFCRRNYLSAFFRCQQEGRLSHYICSYKIQRICDRPVHMAFCCAMKHNRKLMCGK